MSEVIAVDWDAIKAEYVTSNISYRDIADKYDVSMTTVKYHAKRDKWVSSRKNHSTNIYTKATQKAERKEVNRLAKLMQASDGLDRLIERFITGNGAEIAEVDSKAINELSKAIKSAIDIKRDLYGIATDRERDQAEINRRRIELEERKFEQGVDSNNDIVILLGDEADEYAD